VHTTFNSSSPKDPINFSTLMEGVATRILGEPNRKLSKPHKNNMRFGTNGSMSINTKKGVFINHETGECGGVLDFIECHQGCDRPGALDWLKREGFISNHQASRNGFAGNHSNGSRRSTGSDKPKAKRQEQKQEQHQNTPPALYVYELADRTPYLRVKRTADKQFFQSRWTGSDWVDGAPDGPKIPYRLPELLERPDDPAIITEGEKDTDNAPEINSVLSPQLIRAAPALGRQT
jgi:hypothetical protein